MSILDRMREVDVGEWIAERRGRLAAWSASAILAGAVAAGAWWWVSARWRPPPSIFDSPVDSVLSYFTTDDFNRLTVAERVKYVQEFIGRFRGMSQQDSAAAAAFLAGVTGKVRQVAILHNSLPGVVQTCGKPRVRAIRQRE